MSDFVLPSKRKVQESLQSAIEYYHKLRKLLTEVEREDTSPVKCHYHDEWMLAHVTKVLIPDLAKMVVEYARGDCKSGFKPVIFGDEPPLNRIERSPCCTDLGPEISYVIYTGEDRLGAQLHGPVVINTFLDKTVYGFGCASMEVDNNSSHAWISGKVKKGQKQINFSGVLASPQELLALFENNPDVERRSSDTKAWEYHSFGRVVPAPRNNESYDLLLGLT